MEKIMIMIPLLIVVGGLGVTIGLYISSQIKIHIRKNIYDNNIKNHDIQKHKENTERTDR